MRDRSEQTICAISTAPGTGGIATIRVSGPKALNFVSGLAPKLKTKKIESHRAYFADLFDLKNEKVDEVVILYFAKGQSYTGDEVVEISCHGSSYIATRIIDLLVAVGCSLAEPGEFTFRAFMNNRIDLVQAESVLSLIESQNELSAKVALRQLKGATSKNFENIESDLTWCLAHIEASIDFSSEGIEVVDAQELLKKLSVLVAEINQLIESYKAGKVIKEGVKLVLVGKPNVGKSSLLNLLVQDDKAIVTSIAGTTRDVIESQTIFDGLTFQISDTAGIRETKDQVELIGVDRSKKEAFRADVLLIVLSLDDQANWPESIQMAEAFKSSHAVYLINKSDLKSKIELEQIREKLQGTYPTLGEDRVVFTSCLDSSTRNTVLTKAKESLGSLNYLNQAILSSARQFEGALYANQMIEKSILELEKNIGAEFVAMYLKEALISLQRILGHVYDDQILDRVFKEFCLGK